MTTGMKKKEVGRGFLNICNVELNITWVIQLEAFFVRVLITLIMLVSRFGISPAITQEGCKPMKSSSLLKWYLFYLL